MFRRMLSQYTRNVDTESNYPTLESKLRTRGNTDIYNNEDIRVVVLGSTDVGKSTLVNQFLHQRLKAEIRGTILDVYQISDDKVKLEILDTGPFKQTNMRKMTIRNSHAFILVYAINNSQSFKHVMALREEILLIKGDEVPIAVVGTKGDTRRRQVDAVMAEFVVTMDWECPYFEVSAKDTNEVCGVFEFLFRTPYLMSLCKTISCRSVDLKCSKKSRTLSKNDMKM